jgi:hypothetical protein
LDIQDTDALIERIADAVVAKIDEREKINILAQMVIERMKELNQDTKQE